MDRMFSILQVKSYDDEQRIIRGVATTPEPDRVGDIVVSTGVKFKNPSPLLWQHEHDKPVGTVKFDKPTDKGITFEAQLPKIEEPGALKDRVDEGTESGTDREVGHRRGQVGEFDLAGRRGDHRPGHQAVERHRHRQCGRRRLRATRSSRFRTPARRAVPPRSPALASAARPVLHRP